MRITAREFRRWNLYRSRSATRSPGWSKRPGLALTVSRPAIAFACITWSTCGQCAFCKAGTEQFCQTAQMIGKHRDGGYAEFIAVPERSVFRLPDEIPFEQGAILMCSSATSLHALEQGASASR